LWSVATRQELYFHYTIRLNTHVDRSYQPIPGYFVAEAWSESSGGDSYEVCLRITAVRNLARVEVVAEIRASHGGYPVNVGEEWGRVRWADTNVWSGWYSERCWMPIDPSEYPIRFDVHIYAYER